MTFAEKNVWAYLATALVVPAIYFTWLGSQLAGTAASDLAYVRPLLIAVGSAIVLTILSTIVIAIARPSEGHESDVRDRDISRQGELMGATTTTIAMLAAFVLALVDADTMWIANAIYASFVLGAIVGSIVKIRTYRRGF